MGGWRIFDFIVTFRMTLIKQTLITFYDAYPLQHVIPSEDPQRTLCSLKQAFEAELMGKQGEAE